MDSVIKSAKPASVAELVMSVINTLGAFSMALVAFSLRWTSDTYSTAASQPWYHLSNNDWVIVYVILSICSIVVLLIVRRSSFVFLGIASLLLRIYLLAAICTIHYANTTVFKMDYFYGDCFLFGGVIEPLVFTMGLFNGVEFTFLTESITPPPVSAHTPTGASGVIRKRE